MDSRCSGSDSRLSSHSLWRSLICLFFVASLSVLTISAEPSETSDTSSSEDWGGSSASSFSVVDIGLTSALEGIQDDLASIISGDTPIAVYDAPDPDAGLSVLSADDARPFYGSVWIEGTASGLGSGTLYLPINYQSGFLGVTDSGTLVNISSSSLTGYYYTDSGSVYTVTMSFASAPRYRSSSSSTYQDFYFTPSDGNAVIADSDSNLASVEYLLPFITVLFLGVIIVCLLNKSRH